MKLCTPYYTTLTNIAKKLQKNYHQKKKKKKKKKERKKNLSEQLHVEKCCTDYFKYPLHGYLLSLRRAFKKSFLSNWPISAKASCLSTSE